MKVLNRSSNNINIAEFWENYQLKKFNFEPAYQRSGDVWSETKKSFLIDTILKNFPIPPIFLNQHIDYDTGKTIYDVIDGKQRLLAIISFIKNEICIPEDFSEDGFGSEIFNGIYFKDFDRKSSQEEQTELIDAKKAFWRYGITIEYIDTNEDGVVNNIFDRLNRNGEPLTAQELRKAQYNETALYKLIEELSGNPFWKTNLAKLKINRYDDIEFISELLFVILESEISDANSDKIDSLYKKYCNEDKNKEIEDSKENIKAKFNNITKIINDLNLDLKKYKIESVSHLYGLWGFAWQIYCRDIKGEFSHILNEFYTKLRAKESNDYILSYSSSMQAGTKSRSYRIKRINALLNYCGIESI